jgi:Zn-dependent protease with chaperone function
LNESKATRYQRLKRRAHAAGVLSGAAMLAVLALTPASRWLLAWARSLGRGLSGPALAAVTAAAFVGLAVVVWEAVALPAVLYLGLRVDRRFRAAEHTVEGVLAAQAQSTLVALPAAFASVAVVQLAVRLAGPWWWALSAGVFAAGLAAAIRLAPLVVVLLGRARPVERATLVARLAELSRRAGVSIDRVDEFQADASASTTALVAGVGRTRRVFISSEIVRDWSHDEIAVVVAHELAHLARHDLWRTFALDASLLGGALGLADLAVGRFGPSLGLGGPASLAALPLIALVAGCAWVAATPLRHAQSRAHEHRADRAALALTGGAEAFGSAIRRLGAKHLAEERPSRLTRWLYHRHPSVAERLAMAEALTAPTSASPRR